MPHGESGVAWRRLALRRRVHGGVGASNSSLDATDNPYRARGVARRRREPRGPGRCRWSSGSALWTPTWKGGGAAPGTHAACRRLPRTFGPVCSLPNMFSKTFELCKPRSGRCRRPDPSPTPEKGPQKKARLYEATFLVADFPISRLLPYGGGSRRSRRALRRLGMPGLSRFFLRSLCAGSGGRGGDGAPRGVWCRLASPGASPTRTRWGRRLKQLARRHR